MELEQAFLRSPSAVDAAVVEGRTLVLTGPTVEWRLARVEPVPGAEIAGTTRVLDTVVEGGAVTSSAIMPLVTVRLAADGSLWTRAERSLRSRSFRSCPPYRLVASLAYSLGP